MTDEPLVLTVPLMNGEGATDFLSRLAARNGVGTAKQFCTDMGLDHRRLYEGCKSELGRLASLAGIPAGELAEASIRKDGGGYWVRGQRLVAATLRVRRLAACPACLKADVDASKLPPHVAAYGRLAWKLDPVRTCPIHGIGLADLGLSPGLPPQDFSAVVRPHLRRLNELAAQAPRRPPSELERYVLGRLAGAPGTAPFLDGLELHVAVKLCEVVGALAVHGRGVNLSGLGGHDLHLAGAVGISVVGSGEDAIRAFITDLARRYPHGRGVRFGPRPPATDFRIWARANRTKAYAQVRVLVARLFADFPLDPVDGEVGIRSPVRKQPGRRQRTDYISVRPRRLLPEAMSFPSRRDMPVDQTPIRSSLFPSQASGRARTLNTQEAAVHLGCDPVLFQALQAHGLIVPVPDARDWRHAFRREDLDALFTRMLGDAPVLDGHTASAVSLQEAADAVSCNAIEVILLLLAGALPRRMRRAGGRDLTAVLVRTGEVRTALDRFEARGATLVELVAERRMPAVLSSWAIETGAIETVDAVDALTGYPVQIVTQASLDRFAMRYVSIQTISFEFGVKEKSAKAQLDWNHIKPAFKLRTWQTHLYLSEDIDRFFP